MEYVEVCNLGKYQQFKERCPTWVKLHYSILTDVDFIELPDATKWLFVGLILLASQTNNRIPVSWIKSRLGLKVRKVNLEPLMAIGFVARFDDPCISKPFQVQNLQPKPFQMQSGQKIGGDSNPFTPLRREEKRREEKKKRRSDRGRTPLSAPPYALILKDGTEFPITSDHVQELKKTFDKVDVDAQLKQATQWSKDNPGKRKAKTGARKFLSGWMARAAIPPKWAANDNAGKGCPACGEPVDTPGYCDICRKAVKA